MRIFYASDSSPNAAFQSNLWRDNLYEPLKDLGHDVVEFDYDLRETIAKVHADDPEQRAFIERNRPRVTAELMRQLRAAHAARPVDLFFSYFYDVCVLPEAIDEIRGMGIRTVNWFCNASYQLHLVAEISPRYDWCLVPERFRLGDYEALGARPLYCQMAANPKVYKPYDLPVEFGVTFVGQAYGERPAYIKYLLDRGVDARVWGQNWTSYAASAQPPPPEPVPAGRRALHVGRRLLTPGGWRSAAARLRGALAGNGGPPGPAPVFLPDRAVGGRLSDLEMIQMYSRSKINLGFSTCGDTHLGGERIVQIRLRDFEVPMSGGFYMVEYMEELEEFFEVGREIVCYTGPEDLADKIEYYLRHDAEREAVRRAGFERCLRDHTWVRRFERAFAEMGLA